MERKATGRWKRGTDRDRERLPRLEPPLGEAWPPGLRSFPIKRVPNRASCHTNTGLCEPSGSNLSQTHTKGQGS